MSDRTYQIRISEQQRLALLNALQQQHDGAPQDDPVHDPTSSEAALAFMLEAMIGAPADELQDFTC